MLRGKQRVESYFQKKSVPMTAKVTRNQECGRQQILPQSLQKKTALLKPWLQTFASNTAKESVSTVLSPLVCGILLQHPVEMNTSSLY